MKLGDLLLRLAESRRVGKGFGHGLASHSAGQSKLGIVPWIVGLGAVTGWFAAAPDDGGDRARSQITQSEELLEELGSIGLQRSDGIRQGVSAGIKHPQSCRFCRPAPPSAWAGTR